MERRRTDRGSGSLSLGRAGLFAAALLAVTACSREPLEQASPSALSGPASVLDGPGGLADATIPILECPDGGTCGRSCSATVISRRHILTAGHCSALFAEQVLPDHGTFSSCAVHPHILRGTAPTTCPDMMALGTGIVFGLLTSAHDLAVYEASADISGPRRGLAPPRSCFQTERESVLTRGYASYPERRRMVLASAPLSSSPEDGIMLGLLPDGIGNSIDHGDSGGTWVEAWRDSDGPVVAVTSRIDPTIGLQEPFLWAGFDAALGMRNIDWVWSALRDAPGTCVLGAASCAIDGDPQSDRDGDGLPDDRDLCPDFDGRRADAHMTPGEWAQHIDSDGDFLGDDCDAYPGVCDYDADEDGVGDAVDNCPPPAAGDPRLASNPSQADCNEDAERASGEIAPGVPCGATGRCVDAAGASVLHGDACDPNPCAYTRSDTQVQHLDVPGIDPVDRYVVPTLIRTHGVVGGTDVRAPTDMRFCACHLTGDVGDTIVTRFACRAAAAGDCTLAIAGMTGSTAHELFDTSAVLPPPIGVQPPTWRHMTFGISAVTAETDLYHSALASAVWPLGTDQRWDWQLWQPAGDRERWSAPYLDGAVDPAAPAFPGVLWTNSPHDAGVFPPVDSPTRELRSFYTSGPFAPQRLAALPPASQLSHLFPIPDCVFTGQIPCLGTPAWFHVGAQTIFTRSAAYHPPSSLFPSGPMLDATDLVWTHVSEPVELLRPDQTLRMVSSSLDGTRIADVLHVTQYGFTPLGWHPTCPGSPNCPPPTCDPMRDPNQCLAFEAPPGDPLFVLSASRQQLFVVTEGLVAVELEGGARRTIDLGGETFGTLRAATYDVLSDRVLVIDETPPVLGRGPASARLVSIDPDGGGAQVVARWPRYAPTTRFALGAAQDGALYLAASGEHGRYSLVALRTLHHPAETHRDAWDEVVANGIATGDGVVVSDTTYASRFAVTFIVEREGHLEVAEHDPSHGVRFRDDPMGEVF